MNGGTIKLTPDELHSHSKKISDNAAAMAEPIATIENVINDLSGWNSPSKAEYVDKITKLLPKIKKIMEAAQSYGDVGQDTAKRVLATEESIKQQIGGMGEI